MAIFEAMLHRKACELGDVDFTFVLRFFNGLEAISGLWLEGLRVTWDHLGPILGHLEAIFGMLVGYLGPRSPC